MDLKTELVFLLQEAKRYFEEERMGTGLAIVINRLEELIEELLED